MRVYLKNESKFHPDTIRFYWENFDMVSDTTQSEKPEEAADVIVTNDFSPANYPDKIVAVNVTAPDFVKAKEIVSLRGEDLSDLTAVAELCLSMAIYTTRIFKGEEIRGKTLGLIGYGRIGKQLAKIAEFMDMNVFFYDSDRKVNSTMYKVYRDKDWEGDFALKDLLMRSDIVSLHITADESNRNFMDREKFSQMKQGAIFLNPSRDWLVNENDFRWALENKLAGAWEDFYSPLHNDINKYNLVQTNHIGGATRESRAKSEMIIAKKLARMFPKMESMESLLH